MTQSSDLSPSVADLSRLIPTVVPVAEADPELVAVGERYWALAGFTPELGTPVWSEKAKDISVAGWGKQLYVVAAAGVRATVPERACPDCAGPLSLTSRTAFQQVIDGHDPACVECTPSLVAAIEFVTDPSRKAKREKAQAQARAQQVAAGARDRWATAQKEALTEKYPASFPCAGEFPHVGVKEMVATLALLRYAASTSPISQVGDWVTPLYPQAEKIYSVVASTVHADLLAIDPGSPPSAFIWEPASFEQAVQDAGGDLDAVASPRLTGQFYPLKARLFAPLGPSAGIAVKNLDAHLAKELRPAAMNAGRQDDLLALAQELIAGETIRYFNNRLVELNLPAVPDNHTARLTEAAEKVAGHRSIGESYNLAWRATRAAAEAAQRSPYAPRANMTTHAVNQFENLAKQAVDDPDWVIKPFSEIQRHGVAAMTRVLFYTVLDVNPVEATVPSLRLALPAPSVERVPAQAAAGTPEWEDVDLDWLDANPDGWDPRAVPLLLDALAKHEGLAPEWEVDERVVARGATHLRNLYENLAPLLGERHAAMAVFAASELLTHPISVTSVPYTSGKWIQEGLAQFFALEHEGPDDQGPLGDVPEEG
ncbi:hypothetical protein ACIQMY_18850 [Streptomyces sp. NPDC091368]|uniref:hypothetical protein n=1 Tax=Streptomyces sp. NPDC091368 TaxID=3365993 RepID=UPI003825D586